MDPITAAVVAAVAKLAEPAIRDGYEALKSLIGRKFGEESRLVAAVDALEAQPASSARRAVLEEEVAAAGAASDPEVLRTVEAVLELARAGSLGQQAVQQTVEGDRNVFSGTGDVTVHVTGL
jgi:hypothetical protein